MLEWQRLIADRPRAIDASGIRRIFDLGARLADPINLSIGQPDFPVPQPIKDAAKRAIDEDHNGYTVTQGIAPLRERIAQHLCTDSAWDVGEGKDTGLLVTSGTSGALTLAIMSIVGDGDEIIIPDPYFVMYPHVTSMAGGRAVRCDTYPDFRLTAERVEPLITERTKAVLLNSPSNPSGVVSTPDECRDLLDLCRRRGVLLISDEIYDEFTYDDARTQPAHADPEQLRCPSPTREPGSEDTVLLIRGFAKTFGVTGWRLGYAAGPRPLIEQMGKLQQYTFVCAPSPAQHGCIASFDVDMAPHVADYQKRRDLVVERLSKVTDLSVPAGAFYAFPRAPEGEPASKFVERCIDNNVLVIPGGVFSERDTHFRLSYATSERNLQRGLDVLCELLG